MSGFIYVQHSIALFQRCVVNKACRLAAHFSLHDSASNSTNLFISSVFINFARRFASNYKTRVLRDPRSFTFFKELHSQSV